MQNEWVRPQRRFPPMIVATGWTTPDTRYLANNIAQLETRAWPFTGVTVNVFDQNHSEYRSGGSINGEGHGGALNTRAFEETRRFDPNWFSEPKRELELASKRAGSFCDNFLGVTANFSEGPDYPGERKVFHWFDPQWWDNVCHNVGLLAAIASEGGLKGLMIDAEGRSEAGMWTWRDHSYVPDTEHSWLFDKTPYRNVEPAKVVEQVKRRGYEFMDVINTNFPKCILWLTYGYSNVGTYPVDTARTPDRFAQSGNGLWAAFIDGMIEAADSKSIIIDGCEGQYWNRMGQADGFEACEKRPNNTIRPYEHKCLYHRAYGTDGHAYRMTSFPALYPDVVRVGLAVGLLEYPNDLSAKSEPIEDELFIKQLCELSHGYLWFYQERYSWFLPQSGAFPDNVLLPTNSPKPWQSFFDQQGHKLRHSFIKSMREILRNPP